MQPFRIYICEEDADFTRCIAFLLETKRIVDPGLRTADAYAAMLRVLTYGTLIRYEDEQGDVIGIVGYTMGSPHEEYEDGRVAYVEYCLASASRHGTLFFLQGLDVLVRTIEERQPEAVWISFAAAEDHRRNNRLYAKFARHIRRIEDPMMNLNVYTATLEQVREYTEKFN